MDQRNIQTERELPQSYYDPTTDSINIPTFYHDTIEALDPTDYEPLGKVIEQTQHIQNGTTTSKNLEACRQFTEQFGIELHDPTFALHINTLRVLKNLPSIWAETGYLVSGTKTRAIDILQRDCESLILSEELQYLREELSLSTGGYVTRDFLKRELGNSTNIQRHITRKELGEKVLPTVRDIFLKLIK